LTCNFFVVIIKKTAKKGVFAVVGKNIKNARTAAGISQTDLAKRVGISKQTLYKYETGIITNIPSDKIEEISRVLRVTPADLMGWSGPAASSFVCSPSEQLLVEHYRAADLGTKAAVNKLLDISGEDAAGMSAG
jgi:transcriptional regulator with XRE-family HTH domain